MGSRTAFILCFANSGRQGAPSSRPCSEALKPPNGIRMRLDDAVDEHDPGLEPASDAMCCAPSGSRLHMTEPNQKSVVAQIQTQGRVPVNSTDDARSSLAQRACGNVQRGLLK
jgi:hypothetical protein